MTARFRLRVAWHSATLLVPPLLLAGCVGSTQPSIAPAPGGRSATYRCDDGRTVEALYSGRGDAVLTLGERTVALRQAASADGARYVGEGWQWWSKGMTDATLSPLAVGETIAVASGMACHAE